MRILWSFEINQRPRASSARVVVRRMMLVRHLTAIIRGTSSSGAGRVCGCSIGWLAGCPLAWEQRRQDAFISVCVTEQSCPPDHKKTTEARVSCFAERPRVQVCLTCHCAVRK